MPLFSPKESLRDNSSSVRRSINTPLLASMYFLKVTASAFSILVCENNDVTRTTNNTESIFFIRFNFIKILFLFQKSHVKAIKTFARIKRFIFHKLECIFELFQKSLNLFFVFRRK